MKFLSVPSTASVVKPSREMLDDDVQNPPDRFCSAPEQLVSAGKGGDVVRAHDHLANAADGHIERPAHRSRGQMLDRGILVIGNHLDPVIPHLDEIPDLIQGHFLVELDRQALTVAPHGSDAHADPVHGNRLSGSQDLVGLYKTLNF